MTPFLIHTDSPAGIVLVLARDSESAMRYARCFWRLGTGAFSISDHSALNQSMR